MPKRKPNFAPHEEKIKRLKLDDGMTWKEVCERMKNDHGLDATVRVYKGHFQRLKNRPQSDWLWIRDEIHRRKVEEKKESDVYIHDRRVPRETIQKKLDTLKPKSTSASPSPVSQPLHIRIETPKPPNQEPNFLNEGTSHDVSTVPFQESGSIPTTSVTDTGYFPTNQLTRYSGGFPATLDCIPFLEDLGNTPTLHSPLFWSSPETTSSWPVFDNRLPSPSPVFQVNTSLTGLESTVLDKQISVSNTSCLSPSQPNHPSGPQSDHSVQEEVPGSSISSRPIFSSASDLAMLIFAYTSSGKTSLFHFEPRKNRRPTSRFACAGRVADFFIRSSLEMTDEPRQWCSETLSSILVPSNQNETELVFDLTAYFASNNFIDRFAILDFLHSLSERLLLDRLMSFLDSKAPHVAAFVDRVVEAALTCDEMLVIEKLIAKGHKLGRYLRNCKVLRSFLHQSPSNEDIQRHILTEMKTSNWSVPQTLTLLEEVVYRGDHALLSTIMTGFSLGCDSPDGSLTVKATATCLLKRAIARKQLTIVDLLLDLGADPNRATDGHYPLEMCFHLRLDDELVKIARTLRKSGARFPWPGKSLETLYYQLFDIPGVTDEVANVLGIEDNVLRRQLVLLQNINSSQYLDAKRLLKTMDPSTSTTKITSDALFRAAIRSRHPTDFCKLLIEAGFKPRSAKVLRTAAESSYPALKTLLQCGTDMMKFGTEALAAACRVSQFASVALLLEKGVDVNERAGCGKLPLEIAFENHHPSDTSLVEYLIDHGADINNTGVDGMSPSRVLHLAFQTGSRPLVNWLIELGAEVNDTANPGCDGNLLVAIFSPFTPSSYGMVRRRPFLGGEALFQEALSLGVPVPTSAASSRELLRNLIHLGWRRSLGDVLARLTQRPTGPTAPREAEDSQPIVGPSPVELAVKMGDMDVLKLLLNSGEDINSAPARDGGRTPLQTAVENSPCNFELIGWLLDHGADVNAPPAPEKGITVLQGAAIAGNLRLAKMLIDDWGADVNAEPAAKEGRSAIEGAAEHGRLSMVDLLLKEGAVGNPLDERGPFARAIELAEGENHFGLAQFLREPVPTISPDLLLLQV